MEPTLADLTPDDDPDAFQAHADFAGDVTASFSDPETAAMLIELLTVAFWDSAPNAEGWARFYVALTRAMNAVELNVPMLAAYCRLYVFRLDNADLAEHAVE